MTVIRTRVSNLLGLAAAVTAAAALPLGAPGQTTDSVNGAYGRIAGRVLDAATAAPLSSAQVFLVGGEADALAALDGRYVLRDVAPGTREVRVHLIGYGAKTVTGVEVTAGRTTVLDVVLEQRTVELDAITVTATAERGSTTSLLMERRTASGLSDAIGREQMDRSPDGDAAAALKRVPGLSVVDGKFAYVRGLGERYSATTLNDAPLASPVPDRKVIPLDAFPSSLLESIVTSKTYSPDQPGDQAGGLVRIRTRDFPANQVFNLGLGVGWNSEGTFGTGLGYDAGSGLDFLGFDDGARRLPEAVPSGVRVSDAVLSEDRLEAIGKSFRGDWGPTPREVPADISLGASYGNDWDLGDDERLGLLASGNYSNLYDVQRGQVERVFARSGVEDPEVDYRGDVTTHTVRLSGLLNLTYQPAALHRIAFSGVYSRRADDMARILQGFNLDSNTDQFNTRLQYTATSMTNLQLRGEHGLELLGDDATVAWRSAYTRASRYEPSTREVLYREFDGTFIFDEFVQSGSVFHQDQVDAGWSAGTTLTVPLGERSDAWTVSLGASTDRKDREAFARRFRFQPFRGGELSEDELALPPNELFRPERIGPRAFEIREATFREDNYDASEDVDAAFVKLDTRVVPGLRVSGGVRVERFHQTAVPRDLFDTSQPPIPGGDLEATDVLPALDLTLALGDAMSLRGGVSRTVARPQLRELAPFSFADYAGGYLVSGNPTLGRARIRSWDLRWEWFPGLRSVMAVSAFHKSFDDPIEVLVLPSTELIRSWVNAPRARNHGVEVEVRGPLGFLAPSLANVEVNGNLTLVESEVDAGGVSTVYIPQQGPVEIRTIDRARPLQGQSPYMVNLGVTWLDPDGGTTASVLFNRFGERIDAVGRESSPDIYEEARSQLDVVVEHPVGEMTLKLAASRLLGDRVDFTQGGELLRSYELGRTLSLSAAWSPHR